MKDSMGVAVHQGTEHLEEIGFDLDHCQSLSLCVNVPN
jgi:hypothetical protein